MSPAFIVCRGAPVFAKGTNDRKFIAYFVSAETMVHNGETVYTGYYVRKKVGGELVRVGVGRLQSLQSVTDELDSISTDLQEALKTDLLYRESSSRQRTYERHATWTMATPADEVGAHVYQRST
ncbi:hypothetical protein BDN70DRAFT_899193 [Pholiota conissans]|uniref:Uncharacterized protein n=1 Tax=Pholiota conissans TaxID=109636 RepID=A0A9P6CP34_9AGAR|nr:hypothetical protein BDN70DRAFT_899193 [Pholiota conissans]